MATLQVYILDKDASAGEWVRNHLREIGIDAHWVNSASSLLAQSEIEPPTVCMVGLRPPVSQALNLIAGLTQEPRFAQTSFILMGPIQYKRNAFESGADDYLITPPDLIEMRKRVRLYLDRAELQSRVMAEVRITQEFEAIGEGSYPPPAPRPLAFGAKDSYQESITLLEHAATLSQERDLLGSILSHVNDGIAFITCEGVLLYANLAWEQINGWENKVPVGSTVTWPPITDITPVNKDIEAAIRRGDGWRGEVRCTQNDGRRLDVELAIMSAHDANGGLMGFVVVQRDVAQRKALEDLKVRFLTDAGVEMRTPVTNIKMRQYLLRQAPPEQRPMHLQALERETERLSTLVEGMLELARMDSGLIHMNREKTDLNRHVADVVVRYGEPASEKGVTVALSRDDALPPSLVDAGYMVRAVGVLMDNAIQYTPAGGHIDVRLNRETWTGGDFAIIQVKDTGIGIEADDLPRVFDRFFRTARVRDSAIRGLGLNLSIAREIVSRHDGDITVESCPNQGSIFTIWLPLNNS